MAGSPLVVAKVGQLAAVPLAEIPPRRSHQLLTRLKFSTSHTPAGGIVRGSAATRFNRSVRRLENALVVLELGEQPIAALPGCQLMRMSQFKGLLCKLLGLDPRVLDVRTMAVAMAIDRRVQV